MSGQNITVPPTDVAATNTPARPVAARTKLLLEGPIFATLLRLAAPNILNLLAFVAVITFDGFFLVQGHEHDVHRGMRVVLDRWKWRWRTPAGAGRDQKPIADEGMEEQCAGDPKNEDSGVVDRHGGWSVGATCAP